MELEPYNGEHVLVYQTSDSNWRLLDILKEFDDEFIVYGFHHEGRDDNLLFKSFNEDDFFKDLSQARAVISNGGFTLISEAIYLGKPVLSVPVKKQFEQTLNALYLDRLGYGEFHENLERDDIENFLSQLEEYRRNIRLGFAHDHNQSILDELDFLIDKYA
jgi:uncharacterized protein (TIGR00661 family)